jgi:protein O-mannosyl-transferase
MAQPSSFFDERMGSLLKSSRFSACMPPLAVTLLLVMLFFAYSNTFSSPPVLDDLHAIFQEPALRANHWSISNFLQLSQTKFGLRRWVPMLTFSWDTSLGQGQIWPFHLTNLLIHGLCAISALFLCLTLIRHVRQQGPTAENLPSAFDASLWITALWALHPVQTNAVTYLVQRMASLAALFSVLCVAFYACARSGAMSDQGTKFKTVALYGASLIAFGMALLSKETAFILPLLLLFTEAWFFRTDILQRILGLARKHYFISSVIMLSAALASYWILPGLLKGYEGRHFTLGQRVMTEWRVIVWYGSLLLWPTPNRLSVEHDVVVSTSLLQPITTLISFLVLIAAIGWVFQRRKKLPLTTYGILWFLLNLGIESSIIPLELVFEHRLYLPSIGFILAFVLIAHRTVLWLSKTLSGQDVRKITWSSFAIVASVLSLLTFQRNMTWEDAVTLNRDNVSKAPMNPRSHTNLAVVLSLQGAHEEALKEANVAIALGQMNFEAYCEAANIIILSHIGMNDYRKAAEEGERLIAGFPVRGGASTLPLMCLTTSMAYREARDLAGAYRMVLRGLSFSQHLTWRNPSVTALFPVVLAEILEQSRDAATPVGPSYGVPDVGETPEKTWIADILLAFDHWPEANALLQESLAENPRDTSARQLLERMDRDEQRSLAQRERWSFSQKYVRHPYSRFNLFMAVAFLARTTSLPPFVVQYAEHLLDRALMLQPDSADAILLKGWYHFQRSEMEQAIARAREAVKLEPDSARAWLGMGFFLAKAGQNKEAQEAFLKTLELYPRCPERLAITDIMNELQQAISSGT